MKQIRSLLCAATALVAASSWAQETLKIGMFGPLSGPAAVAGTSFQKAWEFAIKDLNAAGGLQIDGKTKRLQLVVEDSQSKPEVGMSAAQKLLTRDNVDILVGDMIHSDVTLAVMELAANFPKVYYTGEPTSLDIAKKIKADPKRFANTWKFDFGSDSYAATAHDTLMYLVAEGKLKPKYKSVAVIAEDSGFSKPVVENLRNMLTQSGWKIGMDEAVPIGQSDFFPQISKLRGANVDYVVSIFTAVNSGIALVKQMKEQSVSTTHMGIYHPGLGNFLQATGPAAEGLLYAPMMFDPAHNAKHKEFATKLKASANTEITLDHLLGYCNASVLIDALKRAGSAQPDKLNAALAATDYTCMTTRWVFDPQTHAPRIGGNYLAVPSAQNQGGKFMVIWPKSVATTDYKAP